MPTLNLSLFSLLSGFSLTTTYLNAAIGLNTETFTLLASLDGEISSTDLVNAGSPSLHSISSTPFTNLAGINNGAPTLSGIAEESSQYTATIDFNLNLSEHPLGYTISSISTLTGISQAEAQVSPWAIGFSELSPNSILFLTV